MSAIGPELPPHLLAKRKRSQNEEPQDGPGTSPGAKRTPSVDDTEKRRRVMGPVMPPAPLDERPTMQPDGMEEDSDDSDDGFGPALPTDGDITTGREIDDHAEFEAELSASMRPAEQERLQRDTWMMVPPKQDDLAARLDPSKPRPKGFNTGKSARHGVTEDGNPSAWHETAEQKRQRLENEMMGVTAGPVGDPTSRTTNTYSSSGPTKRSKPPPAARGPSLLEQHQQYRKENVDDDDDDDPSKRAFDREKDMATGLRISATQRKGLLDRASNFESRFARGGSR